MWGKGSRCEGGGCVDRRDVKEGWRERHDSTTESSCFRINTGRRYIQRETGGWQLGVPAHSSPLETECGRRARRPNKLPCSVPGALEGQGEGGGSTGASSRFRMKNVQRCDVGLKKRGGSAAGVK
jgi:hypothetical protein